MGLPVITTPHTAGPDLIREGMEGFIVPSATARRLPSVSNNCTASLRSGQTCPIERDSAPVRYLDKLRGDPGGMCRPRARSAVVASRGTSERARGEWSTESEDVGIPSWEFRLQGGASLRNLCRTV